MSRIFQIFRALLQTPTVEEDPFAFLDGSEIAISERIFVPCPICRRSMVVTYACGSC